MAGVPAGCHAGATGAPGQRAASTTSGVRVTDPSDLVALERENFVACYRALAEASPAGSVRDGAGTFTFVTGLPLPMFNGCIVTDPEQASGVAEELARLAEQQVPHTLWVPGEVPAEVEDLAAEHGLHREEHPYPGMVLHPVPARPDLPPGLEVAAVDADRVADFARVVVEVGLGEEAADRLTSPSFAGRDDVDLFVGHLDGTPVATSVAISSAGAGGVVNVATLPRARGRGVGTAMTWAAVQAGAARGHDTVVLQATPMGLPVYRTMGFRVVTEYAEYTPG